MTTLILARDKSTDYRVVLGKNASETERCAAAILRKYLRKICGVSFPIARDGAPVGAKEICVGRTNRLDKSARLSSLGEEGTLIARRGASLWLCGGGMRGTLYAVYSFLELLGVRFYAPDCERIPHTNPLRFAMEQDLREKPIVDYRDENWFNARDSVWCEKVKINARNKDRPLSIAGGKGYFGWFVHTMGALAEMTPPFMNKQPCLTDESVFQTVLKNVRQRFIDFPGNSIISVSQNDGTNASAVCQCEKCRAINDKEGTLMGTTLYMANRVADAVRDEYPDVLVDTLSYNFTCEAPRYMKPRENVVIRFVTAFCCEHHPLEKALDEPGAGSERKSLQFNKNLTRWSKIAKTLHMWYYTTSFSNCLTPFPNFESFRRDMRYLTDHRVRGFFLQGNADPDGEFGALRAYLCAKLLWNPRMTKSAYYALIDDFLDGYYGKAGRAIRGYIDLMQKTDPDTHFHLYADPMQIYPPKFTKRGGRTVADMRFVDRGKALWDEAEAAVKDSPVHLRRVQKSRLQHLYYEISLRHALLDATGGGKDAREELARITALNRKLYRTMRRYKIALTEGAKPKDNPDLQNHPLQWASRN